MTDKAKNEYQHNDDGTTYIFIESKGKHFPGKHTVIIDTEDWDKVKGYRWAIVSSSDQANRYPYAGTNIPHPDGGWTGSDGSRRRRRTTLPLHHLILEKPEKGLVIDHIEHNGLDNRKNNLRVCTRSQNCQNKKLRADSASGYKGVHEDKSKNLKPFRAYTGDPNKVSRTISLGYYATAEEAARVYDRKALELYGEYAYTNFPKEDYQ